MIDEQKEIDSYLKSKPTSSNSFIIKSPHIRSILLCHPFRVVLGAVPRSSSAESSMADGGWLCVHHGCSHVLAANEKTKIWRWEQKMNHNKVMQGTYHIKTTPPSRRQCVERVRGISCCGTRLWEAWHPPLWCCRHDAAKVSHQLLCLCCKSYTKL